MTDRTRPLAYLLILALLGWIGWLVYRADTKEERQDRQLADCRSRARLERSYSDGLRACLLDRYHWSDLDAENAYLEAQYDEILSHRH